MTQFASKLIERYLCVTVPLFAFFTHFLYRFALRQKKKKKNRRMKGRSLTRTRRRVYIRVYGEGVKRDNRVVVLSNDSLAAVNSLKKKAETAAWNQ